MCLGTSGDVQTGTRGEDLRVEEENHRYVPDDGKSHVEPRGEVVGERVRTPGVPEGTGVEDLQTKV